ncbi:hypothetical protein B0H13DRAFT_1879246 [Mycena leptocephala]|nr:hypothetical protein B0H13DRAFT_1879246 [Mycena leptocephala]
MNSHDATPTQPARMSSPASVTEISRDEFPPLMAPAPAPATVTKARTKASKGKGKATAKAGSPSKHLRSNTAGDAAPAPFAAVAAAMPTVNTTIAHTAIPVVATGITPVPATAAAPVDTAAAATTLDGAAATVSLDVAPAVPALDAAGAAAAHVSYTETPPGGYPIMVYSADGMINTIPANLFVMYEAVPILNSFCAVIRDAIANLINIEPGDFTLSTPPTAANGTSPDLWLVAGIPAHLAQAIIDQQIISSSRITFFAFPYEMPIVGFVGVFAGFTLPNNVTGANAARDLIRTTTEANNEISQFVQTHRDAFGPQVSAGQAWELFLASIAVHGIVLLVNNTTTVAWRLHIMTTLYGTAQLQRVFRCRICPGIDHPTALCPLPSIPGWLGPTPTTVAALEDASRQAASKAQERNRANSSANAGSSNPRASKGRGKGPSNDKPRKDGKGKKGGDFQGKGKHCERNDFF